MNTDAKRRRFGAGKQLAWSIAETAVCGVVVTVAAWPTLEWLSLLLWLPLLLAWFSAVMAGMAMGMEVVTEVNEKVTDKVKKIIDVIEKRW